MDFPMIIPNCYRTKKWIKTYCKNIDIVSEMNICMVQTACVVRPGSKIDN